MIIFILYILNLNILRLNFIFCRHANTEKKNKITKQLTEVQAKLYTLKNKLWLGAGNGDAPLSWGAGGGIFSDTSTKNPSK